MSKFIRKPRDEGEDVAPPKDVEFVSAYPAVWEYLSEVNADGRPRELATLTVFVEVGRVKICLNDRDHERTAWSSGLSLKEALQSLEKHLQADTVEWRAAGGKGARRRT